MRASCSRPILRIALIAVAVLVVAYPVSAGVGYTINCSNCGFDDKLFYGGGKASATVAIGYCCKCDEFVAISYDRTKTTDEEREKLRTPIGEVFCIESGTRYKVFACPECGGPFAAIDEKTFGDPKDPKAVHCPKCGEKTLTGEATIRWD